MPQCETGCLSPPQAHKPSSLDGALLARRGAYGERVWNNDRAASRRGRAPVAPIQSGDVPRDVTPIGGEAGAAVPPASVGGPQRFIDALYPPLTRSDGPEVSR
jgi:hypothetical protein